MSGTDVAYDATATLCPVLITLCPVLTERHGMVLPERDTAEQQQVIRCGTDKSYITICLRACYYVPGTGDRMVLIAYAFRMRWPVLTQRVVSYLPTRALCDIQY